MELTHYIYFNTNKKYLQYLLTKIYIFHHFAYKDKKIKQKFIKVFNNYNLL